MAKDDGAPPGERPAARRKKPARRAAAKLPAAKAGPGSPPARKQETKRKGRQPPPATQDEIDSRELLAAERQILNLSCEELDRRTGAARGTTSKFLSGAVRYTEERARKLRAALCYDEERFEQELVYRKALRKAARGSSWIRSPHQRRARPADKVQQPLPIDDKEDEEEVAPRRAPMPEALQLIDDLLAQLNPDLIDPRRQQVPPAGGSKRKKKPPAPR